MSNYLLPPVAGERPAKVPAPPAGADQATITTVLRVAFHAPSACRADDPTAFAVSVWRRRWALYGQPGWAAQATRDAADLARIAPMAVDVSSSLSIEVLTSRDKRVLGWTSDLLGHDLACSIETECASCALLDREDFVGVLQLLGLPAIIWRDFTRSLVRAGFVRPEPTHYRAVIAGAPIPADLDF